MKRITLAALIMFGCDVADDGAPDFRNHVTAPGPGCQLGQDGNPVHSLWQMLVFGVQCDLAPEPGDCRRLLGRLYGATPQQAAIAIQLEQHGCVVYANPVCPWCPPATQPCAGLINAADNAVGPIGCAFDEGDFDGCMAYGDGLDETTVAATCGALVLP